LNLTRRLHQCTPELFGAEDPISLRCWGKIVFIITKANLIDFEIGKIVIFVKVLDFLNRDPY